MTFDAVSANDQDSFMSSNSQRSVRFHFYTGPIDHLSSGYDSYHNNLIEVEVMLERAICAQKDGLLPVNMALTSQSIHAALDRPARAPLSHAPMSPEYVRWFDAEGASRLRPLSTEDLTQEIVRSQEVSLVAASHLVSTNSHAISGIDHLWLEVRDQAKSDRRPLDASEYLLMVKSIDAALQGLEDTDAKMQVNADVALKAAAIVGTLHDSYQPSCFKSQVLTTAYLEAHRNHLQTIVSSAVQVEEILRLNGASEEQMGCAKDDRKSAEFAADLAELAIAGVDPVPVALSVCLETADGREVWWSVVADPADPFGVNHSPVCEAVISADLNTAPDNFGETVKFAIEVHWNDGSTPGTAEGNGDVWRAMEDSGSLDDLYIGLLQGNAFDDLVEKHSQPSAPMPC